MLMKDAARPGFTASMQASRLSRRKTATSPFAHSGALRRSKRPVTSATAITTAITPSTGAGSKRTMPSSRKPTATAASYRQIASATTPSSPMPAPTETQSEGPAPPSPRATAALSASASATPSAGMSARSGSEREEASRR